MYLLFCLVGRLGFASYKISTGAAGENYKHTCLNWIKSETPYREEYVAALENMPQCPCANRFLFFDRRFLFVPWWTLSTSTFTTSVFPRRTDLPYGKVCKIHVSVCIELSAKDPKQYCINSCA